MNSRREFAQRYLHIKRSLEELAQAEYARTVDDKVQCEDEVAAVMQARKEARANLGLSSTRADWELIHAYEQRLSEMESTSRVELQRALQQVDETRQKLTEAYIQTQTWQSYSSQLTSLWLQGIEKAEQREADERAVQMRERGQ